MTETETRWIELDGAVNVRDLGGLTTTDGRRTQPDRLIRADNLQGLSAADVRRLIDDHHVRVIVDLRTGTEVAHEGPGPMTREPLIALYNYSLFPESGQNTDAAAIDEDAPVVLPWQNRGDDGRRGASGIYLRYLDDRADSVLKTLRQIAHSDGATLVHCAAGKDRTGVVVAMALAEVGVVRESIIDDYALTAERIEAIFARLRSSRTYAADIDTQSVDKHSPREMTMRRLLDALDEAHGGVGAWLRSQGWTEDDASVLRAKLLDA